MSKAAWKTLFGLKRSRWVGRDPARRALPPDCETVVTRPALREAGVRNATRALRALLGDRAPHYAPTSPVAPLTPPGGNGYRCAMPRRLDRHDR